MVVALLVVGTLGPPLTGLLVRPRVRGARHGLVMVVDLGRFVWYGYTAAAVALLVLGLVGVLAGSPRGRRLAGRVLDVLVPLTAVLGAADALVVAVGPFLGDGRPLLAAVIVLVAAGAVLALVTARARLRG